MIIQAWSTSPSRCKWALVNRYKMEGLGQGRDSSQDGGEFLNHGLTGVGAHAQSFFVVADLGICPLQVLDRSLRRIRQVLNGIAPITEGKDWPVAS